jgi:hypothetical protein
VEELNRSISEMEGEISEINHLLYPSLSIENDDFFIDTAFNVSSGASYGSFMDNGSGLGGQNDPLVRSFIASYYRKKEINRRKLKTPANNIPANSGGNFEQDVIKEEEVVVCHIDIIVVYSLCY